MILIMEIYISVHFTVPIICNLPVHCNWPSLTLVIGRKAFSKILFIHLPSYTYCVCTQWNKPGNKTESMNCIRQYPWLYLFHCYNKTAVCSVTAHNDLRRPEELGSLVMHELVSHRGSLGKFPSISCRTWEMLGESPWLSPLICHVASDYRALTLKDKCSQILFQVLLHFYYLSSCPADTI